VTEFLIVNKRNISDWSQLTFWREKNCLIENAAEFEWTKYKYQKHLSGFESRPINLYSDDLAEWPHMARICGVAVEYRPTELHENREK
jgi:hypothetical protein